MILFAKSSIFSTAQMFTVVPFWRIQFTTMTFRSSSSGKYKDIFVPVSGIQYTFPPVQSGGGLSKSFPYPAPRGKGALWKHPASYQSLSRASRHPLRFLSLSHGWTGPQTWGYRQLLPPHRRPCPGYKYNGTLPAKAGYAFPVPSTGPRHRQFSPHDGISSGAYLSLSHNKIVLKFKSYQCLILKCFF